MSKISKVNKLEVMKQIINCKNFLLIQDIDGVCIPLVKDPLNRTIDYEYINSIYNLKNKFFVLTCGEHEGQRGVNRIIETALNSKDLAKIEGLYLPGLAACGIEYQNNFGKIKLIGINKKEIDFLQKAPIIIKELLTRELELLFTEFSKEEIENHINIAVCDTRFSPAINLNSLFLIIRNDITKMRTLQKTIQKVMEKVIELSRNYGLQKSFYLHISPNLGKQGDKEIIKLATHEDIGTTDIQLIINGALKEAGLLVLINESIKIKSGTRPFGDDFNVRNAPKTIDGLISLCKEKVSPKAMPTLIGVGDTVTSSKISSSNKWSRGGSDRGFLTLIQELGKAYNKENRIIFVDSSHGEVNRPSVINGNLNGISDPEDPLKFDLIMNEGPKEYIKWIKLLSKRIGTKI